MRKMSFEVRALLGLHELGIHHYGFGRDESLAFIRVSGIFYEWDTF